MTSTDTDQSRAYIACRGLARVLELMAETYPHPEGRPVHMALSLDNGLTVHVDVDLETMSFLSSRAAESAGLVQVRRRRNALRLIQGAQAVPAPAKSTD